MRSLRSSWPHGTLTGETAQLIKGLPYKCMHKSWAAGDVYVTPVLGVRVSPWPASLAKPASSMYRGCVSNKKWSSGQTAQWIKDTGTV